ncbi:DNA-directed RNA polymerase II 19 kDa polypeptide [Delitschia confertaspora ATCC 74209]|uniref:DNA-directed RNA polymerase subunit n=1 Tax=Delitschia confertaspora ATCC 74209 TaxID=1513339 RepID=A0A9P4JRE2_9PLEO|nr:DNA-directed RNA polymerase II 19 kDa polypeptide [Delitschia confertaspora ATCC 74209]
MFFVKEMERTIQLHPSYFGPQIRQHLHRELLTKVEGQNMGQYIIVCILDAFDISDGVVMPGSGHAEYIIHYKAIVWKPFKGEIVDGEVTSVIRAGFFLDVGAMRAFVARSSIPADMKYDANATPPQWTDNADQVIEKGTQVRFKIIGVRTEVAEMFAVGSIKEDYLGAITSL